MSRVARLGAFIVVTLAVLATGVFIIGSKEYLFRSTYQLKAQFKDVVGLAEGADVQVGGVHSGTVTGIELPRKPGDEVTVIMELAKSTHEIIKQDSVASIQTEGLLGNQYLAVSFGSSGHAEVRDGETIQSEPPLEMADLLRKTNGILDSSQEAVQNITMATAHLNSVSTKIDSGQGTVGALVNDKQLYSDLEQTTTTLHATMLQAQTGVTDFQENMEALKHNFLLSGYFKKRGYEDSADLGANAIGALPQGTPVKVFSYTVKQLFDGRDSAKLKNQKSLKAVGEFLAQNQFGVAVITASTGMEGDSQKDTVLTEARAMIIREYLAGNFGFDNSLLKTLGIGKEADPSADADWGSIQILIFATGTEMPADKPSQPASAPIASASQSLPAAAGAAQKQ
ncbi:MAG TPA: MlaD family protein [Terracidiphilus sp.]|jgi:phospholipid/cholesterol/gamma-HCH transport system substrate-binding protein|nr:MlaD family protein [Terracidiphilus sp.]